MPPAKTARRKAPPTRIISDQLRDIIAGRGLTPYSIAMEAGVAPSVIARFLNRERGMTLDTLDAVAETLRLHLVEGRGGLRK